MHDDISEPRDKKFRERCLAVCLAAAKSQKNGWGAGHFKSGFVANSGWLLRDLDCRATLGVLSEMRPPPLPSLPASDCFRISECLVIFHRPWERS